MQRALDPTSVENGLRSKFAHDVAPLKAMGLHNEAPWFQLAEDRLVGERLRDLDCELGMQTRWWDDEVVDDTSSTENYCRFVDACLLAAEDALTVNQSLIGPYAEITFRLEDGALGYLQAFLQAAHRLQELPPILISRVSTSCGVIPRRAPFDLSASESMRQSRTGEDGYTYPTSRRSRKIT